MSEPEKNKRNEEDETEEEVERIEAKREEQRYETMKERTDELTHHTRWIGSNLDIKRKRVGLRVGTNNFQRKLYATEENLIETIVQCEKIKIDILVGTEPGQGTLANRIRAKNTLRKYGYGLIVATRDESTIGGGIAVILGPKWAKIPNTKNIYNPANRELRGRAMAVVFNNQIPGAHNKIQIIAVHGLNAAEIKVEDTIALLAWVAKQKEEFKTENRMATTVLLGDLNATINTLLDTDRQEKEKREVDPEEEEKDAYVIKEIQKMGLTDIFRGRYPATKVTTRRSKDQTNRFLDKIMATSEVAAHPDTEIAVYKEQFLIAGSDHKMIVADLPIDTAGVADERIAIWTKRKVVKWVKDCDEMGKTDQSKIDAFNEKLAGMEYQGKGGMEYIQWVMEAAKGTILKENITTYPKKVSLEKMYTADDHKMRANLKALRHAALMIEEGVNSTTAMTRTRRRLQPVKETEMNQKKIAQITKQMKKNKNNKEIPLITEAIEYAEHHLLHKSRLTRAAKIRKSIKLRNDRFKDDGKLMLKMVINSLMRRYRDNEEITAVNEGGNMVYDEKQVQRVVKEFYQEWTESKIGVQERFESWEQMLECKGGKTKHKRHERIIKEAYQESKEKYDKKQQEEGIWNNIRRQINLKNLRDAIKAMKKGRAPGPSALTYDILAAMEDEHLEPLVKIINKAMTTGKVEDEINKALLRPLPKTDQGLAELSKTRPIALMETIMKLIEKIIFDRIIGVLDEHNMLRKEQHGGLARRTAKSPIRSLAEIIEDAAQTGQELHIFSADIAKAFDSIEYWSQAMSWSALGMPADLIQMLVQMDQEGETSVILGQGRQSDWFKAGRGVRQGSIGGPIKWVVFINFWLELVHKVAEGEGYNMSEAAPGDKESLGQVFVDDSNWIAKSVEGMELLISLGEEFTEFHGIKFNKAKCEYMVANQKRNNKNEYDLPRWNNGDVIEPKMRKARKTKQEKEMHKKAKEDIRKLMEGALEFEGIPVRNPTDEEHGQIDKAIEEWEEAVIEGEAKEANRNKVVTMRTINIIKGEIYIASEMTSIMNDTAQWAEEMHNALETNKGHWGGKGKASRYLGVWFEMDHRWRTQRKILQNKFKDLNDRINKSKPNREQATYCVNAVINAAMKFPLQVAHIPKTTLKQWDAKNRETVRKAGYIPKLASGLAHIKKEYGGMGLQSLEIEMTKGRIVDQMQWLNSESTTGQIVRAAKRRWEKNKELEKYTIQAYTMEEIENLGAEIIEEKEVTADAWGRKSTKSNYQGKDEQRATDIEKARSNPKRGERVHSFGDGATWQEEERSGWGISLMSENGETKTVNGRTAGKQANDASETRAILQGLLETNPEDDLTIYCDNQGCIDTWHKPMKMHKLMGIERNNKAMWNRIQAVREHREDVGSETRMEWVHSHVDDEKRRKKGGKGKYTCACGGTNEEGQEGCTKPNEEGHWVHVGNEAADSEAAEGAKKQKPDKEEVRAGEYPYIIVSKENDTDSAQGSYKEWVELKQWQKAGETPSTSRDRIEEAGKIADKRATRSMIKSLGQEGAVTWRFWSRVFLRCLPTHSQMIKFAKGSEDNVYKTVYEDTIGEEGQCVRCKCKKETTLHAIYECEAVRMRWGSTNHKIEEMWREEGEQWNRVDWTVRGEAEARYPGWEQELTVAGMAPEGAKQKMQEQGPGAEKLINKTIQMILKTAHAAWEDRNEKTQDWLDSNPELKERKKLADRTGWRTEPKKRAQKEKREGEDPRDEGRGDRYKRIKKEAIGHLEETRKRKVEEVEVKMENILQYCEEHQILPAHPAERERMKKDMVRKLCRQAEGEKKMAIMRADMAEGTRDLEATEMGKGKMQDTQPTVSTLKRKFHWTPKIGQHVEALWTGKEGVKVGNLKGTWWKGKVIGLEWPEEEGIPGAIIKYEDGHREWHGINTFGITIKPRKKPRNNKGIPYDATLPKVAETWMGIGTRMRIKWTGAGWPEGTVIGEEEQGIMVRYKDGSVVAHNDLTWRGCKVIEYRKPKDQDEYYQERPWLKCPYGGEEEDCECWPCKQARKWEAATAELGEEDRTRVLNSPEESREQLIQSMPKINVTAHSGGHLAARDGERASKRSDTGSAEGDNPYQEREDEDTKVACEEGNKLERATETDREAARGQDLGLGSGSGGQRRTRAQRQGNVEAGVAECGGEGDPSSKRGRSVGRGRTGAAPSTLCGSHGSGHDMDHGERGTAEGRAVGAETPETEPDDGGEEGDGEAQGGEEGHIRSTDETHDGREDQTDRNPEQEQQRERQRGMEGMEGGNDRLDAGTKVGIRGGSRSDERSSGKGEGAAPAREATHCGGHGRRVGKRKEGPTGPPGGQSHRDRQKGAHIHRSKARGDHSSSAPRSDCEREEGPAHHDSQEGGTRPEQMDTAMDVPGVLVNVSGECNEPGNRISAWKMGEHGEKQSECNGGENPAGDGVPARIGGNAAQRDARAGGPPEAEVCTREPSHVANLEGNTGEGRDGETPRMETDQGGPVRVREEIPEADQHPDQPAELDAEGEDWERKVQTGSVRRDRAQRKRGRPARGTNSAELQGQAPETRGKARREMGLHEGSGDKLSGRRAGGRDHEDSDGRANRKRKPGEVMRGYAQGPPRGPPQRRTQEPPRKKQKTSKAGKTPTTGEPSRKSIERTTSEQTKIFDPGD
jgi:ribonuclease HI